MSTEHYNNLISDPIISIIVPMYNVESLIARAIESVINQTFDKWELILVNDKSDDKTEEICLEYAKKDARIKVLKNNFKRGASFARATGLQNAKGDYIAFLDADDWYESEYLMTLYKLFADNDCEISCCSHYLAYDKKRKAVRDDNRLNILDKEQALSSLLEHDGLISSMLWDKLFKREYLASINLTEEIVVGEDFSLLVDTLEKINKVVVKNVPLYNYYQREQSVCNSGYTEKREKTIENYKRYTDYICSKYPNLKDKALAYLTVQELAIIVSMTKNNNYDNRVIDLVMQDVRKNKKSLYRCKQYKFRYKLSTFIACLSPKILIFMGRVRSKLSKRSR